MRKELLQWEKRFIDTFRRNRIRILLYHNVCRSENDIFSVSPQGFILQMELLARTSLPVLSLEQAVITLSQPKLLKRGIVITFDDAYQDLSINAIPVLLEMKFPATIFAVAGKTGQVSDWGSSSPPYQTLTWHKLARLVRMGFSIGSHSLTHTRLTLLGATAMENELNKSRKLIQDQIGHNFIPFSYPYGDFGEREKITARQIGYDCGVAAGGLWGNGADTDLFVLNREFIINKTNLKTFQRIITGRNDLHLLWKKVKKYRRFLKN